VLACEKLDGGPPGPLGPPLAHLLGDGEQGLDDVLCAVVERRNATARIR
jgi:hypothetical protein